MGTAAEIVEVEGDSADTRVCMVCGRRGLFLVEVALVLVQLQCLRGLAKFLWHRGHDVDLIVDNHCQAQ